MATHSRSDTVRKGRILLLAALAAVPGCFGGAADLPNDLAPVTGTVMLDGQPLAEAIVTFTPKSAGSISSGVTDAEGRFTLMYNADLPGAVPGTHVVRISKMIDETAEETIPARYNEQSEATCDVAGEVPNDFPLLLKSK
ncbi:MAG: carboxypeptidase-like regulatory domain-containing protein [Planctomycetaceae bacterium]